MVERRIDMQYLVWAWQDDSPDNSYYLDKNTGDVRLVNRHLLDLRQLTDEIEKNRERYLYLPKPDPADLLADLHDFVHTVTDPRARQILPIAFESPHVLSAFRKILDTIPNELERMNQYLDERVRKRVASWMKANAIEEVFRVDDDEIEDDDEDKQDYDLEDFSVPT